MRVIILYLQHYVHNIIFRTNLNCPQKNTKNRFPSVLDGGGERLFEYAKITRNIDFFHPTCNLRRVLFNTLS